jgi:aldehyde dehydrogenase (NAD+)
MIQAITAGNCCLIKPSEHAPHSAEAFKKFVYKYLDTDAIDVCLGDIPVATAVNNLKLDLICFTGSTFVGKIVA